MLENLLFYKKITKHNSGLIKLLGQPEHFRNVPENWCVCVVDVENSTDAVQKGKSQEVNLAATGSIVTVLNEIRKTNKSIRIPYFFGGDGATFLIPNQFEERVLVLLENYRHHIKLKTSLILRVGCVKVAKIYQQNHQIKIAKLALTEYLTIPVVLGFGLKHAEELIKASFIDIPKEPNQIQEVKLLGYGVSLERDKT